MEKNAAFVLIFLLSSLLYHLGFLVTGIILGAWTYGIVVGTLIRLGVGNGEATLSGVLVWVATVFVVYGSGKIIYRAALRVAKRFFGFDARVWTNTYAKDLPV